MRSKKKLTLVASLTLAVLLVISGTFAWFTAQDSVINKLKTTDSPAGAEIVEVFTPVDDWKPGQTVAKEVGVVNTGESPVLTRIHFEEILKLMKPAAAEVSVFNDTMADAGKLPVLFDAGAYYNSTAGINGWYVVTTTANTANLGGLKLAAAAPADVVVLAKMATTGDVSSNNLRTAYNFTAFAVIPAGTDYEARYQKIEVEFNFDKAEKELDLANIGYMTYGGKYEFDANWPNAKPFEADIVKSVTEGLAAATLYPDINGSYIQLNYGAAVNDTLDTGTWFYNEADGYFYYIGKLMPGTATANLLSSLTLNAAAGNAYANMDFDLIVNMDAIQNTQDAVIGVWNLPAGSLLTALTAFCE